MAWRSSSGYCSKDAGLRDQGVWRAEVVDYKPQSLHVFRSHRRAVAIERSAKLVFKLQEDRIGISWQLAQAHEEMAIKSSWWENKFEEMNNNLADKVNRLASTHAELANVNMDNEEKTRKLVAAQEELAIVNERNEDQVKELAVAHEEMANVNKSNEDRVKEMAMAREELANVNMQYEDKVKELAAAHEDMVRVNKQNEDKVKELAAAHAGEREQAQ